MKNYIVTGAAGFIGSHLAEKLLRRGNNVFAIDNFCDFYDPAVKRKNIVEVLKSAGDASSFRLYEGDIRNMEFLRHALTDAIRKAGPRHNFTMVHVAAMAGVRPSLERPALYNEVNIGGTLNLLELCRELEIKKFLFASSSSVYGNNEKVPFSESDSVDHPISVYAATKKAGELLCHTYWHLYGIKTICLRFFTVYGARQRPDLAIHKFTDLMLKGQPVPVFGDGSTRRDYTYIHDITDGTLKAIDRLDRNEASGFEIFNLGESQTITLSYLIEVIEKELGVKAVKNVQPLQPGDVNTTFADISRAREVLGYAPQTPIEEGIKHFIRWKLDNESKILDLGEKD